MHSRQGSAEYKIPSLLLISAFVVAGCSSGGSSDPEPIMVNQNETGTVTGAGTDTGTTVMGTDEGTVTGIDNGTTDVGTVDTGTGGSTASPTTVGLAGCAALSANGSTASIAGLYDISETFGPNLVDVAYLEISDNGALTLYDYQQDDLDQGDNCYIIESGVSVLSPLGNNEFASNYYIDADFECETFSEQVTIIRTETELTATFVDTEDEDEDGDTTDLITDVLPVVTGLSTESFNRCE